MILLQQTGSLGRTTIVDNIKLDDIKSKIVLLGKGHGGSEEFNVFFKSDKFAYALVKVVLNELIRLI